MDTEGRARRPGIHAMSAATLDTWEGCYAGSWRNIITPESFAHPAKMAPDLTRRIFRHLAELGVAPGSLVLDPFGGIGSTAIIGTEAGYRVVSVELEPRFVGLHRANLERHRWRWEQLGRDLPVVVQGDSRQLRRVLEQADGGGGIDLAKMSRPGGRSTQAALDGYGHEPGQLADLPPGDVDAVVSSPPYSGIAAGQGGLNHLPGKEPGQQSGRTKGPSQDTDTRYGEAEGQLSRLREGDIDAVVGSPPWMDEAAGDLRASKFRDPAGFAAGMAARDGQGGRNGTTASSRLAQMSRGEERVYGQTEGQLGNDQGETFWSAARQIVAECLAVLRPGGLAVWVTKDFVRDRQRVPFSDDWQRLCEAVGFELASRHAASLVTETREPGLFGEEHVTRRERKSFFRRLAEAKGSPRIDHEDVICVRRPA